MARDNDGRCYVEGAFTDVCVVSKAFEYLLVCLKYDMRMDLKDIHQTVSVGVQADALELYYGSQVDEDEMDANQITIIKPEAPDDYNDYDEVMAEDTEEEEDGDYVVKSEEELPEDHEIDEDYVEEGEDDDEDAHDDDDDDYSPSKKSKKKKTSPSKSPASSSTETTPVKTPKKSGRKPKVRDPNAPPPEFKCQVEGCSYVTTKRDNLRDHTRRMHEEKKLTCHICNRMYGTSKDFKRHLKSHLAMHKCEICGKTYRNARNLKEHQEKHGDNYQKPEIPCDLCSKTFCNKFVLQLHIKRIHEGINPRNFLCDYCGKAFQNRHILMEHENTHTGARPFKCKLCDDACFRHSAGLRLHMKSMHNDGPERIWPCDLCDKKFRSVTGLRFHSQLHKGPPPHKCDFCEKCFYQKGARDRHLRTHTGERPYGCKLCGEKFSDNSILRRHMMGLHKEEYEKNRKKRKYLAKDDKDEEHQITEATEEVVPVRDKKQEEIVTDSPVGQPAPPEVKEPSVFLPKKEENGESEAAPGKAPSNIGTTYAGASSNSVSNTVGAPSMLPYQGVLPWLPPFTQSFKSAIPQYLSDVGPSTPPPSKGVGDSVIKTENAPSPNPPQTQPGNQFRNSSNHSSSDSISTSNMAPYLWDMFAQNMQRSYGHGVQDSEVQYNMVSSRQPAFPEHIDHRSSPDTHPS